jgi:hypothetical protein
MFALTITQASHLPCLRARICFGPPSGTSFRGALAVRVEPLIAVLSSARFARRSLFAGLAAFGLALAAFFAIGGLRLWPRVSGQQLPFSLIWPFARPLLAAGLELAFLISVPVALGLAVNGRAVRASGEASGRASALATCLLLLVLGVPTFTVSSWLDSRGSSPGQLATELVASARESCVESSPRAEVTVPLLGFAWVCEAGRAPRLQGRAPLGKQASFQAAAIELSDDLKRVALHGFTLAFPLPTLQVQVRTKQATLRGLPPWGRSRKIPITVRVCLFALSAGLAAWGVARLTSARAWLPVWAGGLVGLFVSGCLYWAEAWLERREPHGVTYLVLPVAGLLGVGLCGVLLILLERLLERRAGSPDGPPRA